METNTELECCKALIWLFSVLTSESSAFELVCLFGKKGNTSQSTIQHIYIKKTRAGREDAPHCISLRGSKPASGQEKNLPNPGCTSKVDFYCAALRIRALGGWHLYWMHYHWATSSSAKLRLALAQVYVTVCRHILYLCKLLPMFFMHKMQNMKSQ